MTRRATSPRLAIRTLLERAASRGDPPASVACASRERHWCLPVRRRTHRASGDRLAARVRVVAFRLSASFISNTRSFAPRTPCGAHARRWHPACPPTAAIQRILFDDTVHEGQVALRLAVRRSVRPSRTGGACGRSRSCGARTVRSRRGRAPSAPRGSRSCAAVEAAITMSHTATRPAPPPMAAPCRRPITGCGQRSMASKAAWNAAASARFSSLRVVRRRVASMPGHHPHRRTCHALLAPPRVALRLLASSWKTRRRARRRHGHRTRCACRAGSTRRGPPHRPVRAGFRTPSSPTSGRPAHAPARAVRCGWRTAQDPRCRASA